jgi:hypothetical protein
VKVTVRSIEHRYTDPLDRVWLTTAAKLGLRVVRSDQAYAATDGRGTLLVGTPETLDPDDCLAQIVFHELCHALVEGEEAHALPDWGLCNETERDLAREQACLRVQAALAARHGLRRFLAPTTEHRAFYDALPENPLAGPEGDASVAAARTALARAGASFWAPLHAALAATAQISAAARAFAPEGDLLATAPAARAGRHPLGLDLGPVGETCGSCAWLGATPRGTRRCRVAGAPTSPRAPACASWEPPLDCRSCGACCREAYHVVEVGRREAAVKRHPDFIAEVGGRLTLRREGTRCAALAAHLGGFDYTCAIYADRPRTCREFEVGGVHCLEARRRVGLSRRLP